MMPAGRAIPLAACPRRRGAVLIVAMWILVVLAAMVVALAANMRVEACASASDASRAQAEAIEAAAVQYVFSRIDNLKGRMPSDTDMLCEAVRVGDGAFWILKPNFEDDKVRAYGVVDEASKLNLNTAGATAMSLLPGMTSDLAAGIVDWRDSDSDSTDVGAEDDYYMRLDEPYHAKNADFETVEELLLVKDFTRDLLYGEDINRNGITDAGEDTDGDGALDRGPGFFFTIYSTEPNTDADGKARVNVNETNQSAALDDVLKALPASQVAQVRSRIRFGRPFRSLMDFYIRSGLKAADFDLISDKLTTRSDKNVRGLVNLLTAPREVLLTLPGMEEADANAILAKRIDTTQNLTSITWIPQTIKPAKAVAIGDRITLKTWVFSADIVSVSGDGRAFRRTRVVIDARTSPPKVIFRQPLTHLGWPLDESIRTRLRAGVNIDTVCNERQTAKTSTP